MPTPTSDSGDAGGSGENGPDAEESLRRNEDADPVQIHREYVERRIGGGAPPTSDAYARAIEEFQQVPGAVRTPPTETTDETARLRAKPAGIEPEAAKPRAEREAGEEAVAEESPPDDTGGVWEQDR
jgi:hypothetical protein